METVNIKIDTTDEVETSKVENSEVSFMAGLTRTQIIVSLILLMGIYSFIVDQMLKVKLKPIHEDITKIIATLNKFEPNRMTTVEERQLRLIQAVEERKEVH